MLQQRVLAMDTTNTTYYLYSLALSGNKSRWREVHGLFFDFQTEESPEFFIARILGFVTP